MDNVIANNEVNSGVTELNALQGQLGGNNEALIPPKKKQTNPNSLKNLKHIKPGQVLNPTGRPKGTRDFITIYTEALKKIANTRGITAEEVEDTLLKSGLAKALGGDYRFYKDTLDRLHGLPTQKQDITHSVKPTPILADTMGVTPPPPLNDNSLIENTSGSQKNFSPENSSNPNVNNVSPNMDELMESSSI